MARILEASQIEKLLFENAKRFQSPGWMFAENTNMNEPKDWSQAKLRILIQFLSNGETRAVSSTDIALLSTIREKAPVEDVFIDVCFLPNQHNAEILEELNLPWSFGNVSHHSVHDYDLVLVSNSTVDEKYNLFAVWDKSDFPMWATERLDNSNLPLVMYGGAASSEGEPLYGKSLDGKNQSLVDVTYVGFAEPYLASIVEKLVSYKESGSYHKKDIIQGLYEFPCIYNPLAYVHHFDSDNWTIKQIEKVDPKAPAKVRAAKVPEDEVNSHPGFELKTLYNDGNFDSVDIQISWGCSGKSVCSFCHEGNAHAWREKSFDKIKSEIKAARNRSIAHTYSSYSYNTNFHSRYEDIMAYASKVFPKVSSISMRADEIAARPDYFKMDKFLGIVRMTLGVEGVSDRIRNGYLNKSLSYEAILNAARACFANRFMQVKLFFILSGREEQADWEEGVKLVNDIINLRNSLGANTHVKVSFSLLCHYPHTPIAWDERLSIKHTITGGRISYFIDECRKIGVGVRFSSRGKSVVFQQLNLDLGRPMTAIFEKLYRRTGWVYYRNVPDGIVDELEGIIKEQGLPDTMTILGKRPYEWIFPSDVIHVKSEKFLIDESKRINEYKPQEYCLRTQARPEIHKCGACGLCEKKATMDHMVSRPIAQSEASVDDIIAAMSFNKPRYRYRFVFDTPRKYDFLKKRPLGHFFFTKFFTEEEKDLLYSVETGSDPSRWNVHNELTYPFYGQFILDVSTREDMGDLTLRSLQSSTILRNLSVTKVPINFEIKTSDLALVVLETKPLQDLLVMMRSKAGIGYPYMKNDFPLEWDVDREGYPEPLLKKAETFKFLMTVPVRANMIKFLSNVTGRTYYNVLDAIHESTQYLGYYRQIKGAKCSLCGNDAVMNLANGKLMNFCPECLQKLVFNKL